MPADKPQREQISLGTALVTTRPKTRRLFFTAVTAAVVVIVLSVVTARSFRWLKDHKDELASLQSIVQILFLVGGGFLAYDRFFRGRGAVSRAQLMLNVVVSEASPEQCLHIIQLSVTNVGVISIWSPAPELRLRKIGPAPDAPIAPWEQLSLCESSQPANDVIDSGETVVFCTFCRVTRSCWAVEYEAVVKDSDGTPWFAKVIAPNKESNA